MNRQQQKSMFHHVALSVRDLDRALSFYRDLLGFEVDWDMDHRGGGPLSRVVGLDKADAHVIMLQGHGMRLELFSYYHPQGQDQGFKRPCDFGITHFALAVRDVDDMYQRLVKAGVKFNCEPQVLRPGVKAAYLRDFEGVTIELIQYD